MTLRWGILILAGLCILGYFTLLRLPGEYVLNEECLPDGLFNRTKARLRGSAFWAAQVDGIDRETAASESWPEIMAAVQHEMAPALAEMDQSMDSLYREFPELRPPAQSLADSLRALADSIERAEMFAFLEEARVRRIDELQRCRAQLRGLH